MYILKPMLKSSCDRQSLDVGSTWGLLSQELERGMVCMHVLKTQSKKSITLSFLAKPEIVKVISGCIQLESVEIDVLHCVSRNTGG